jgi:hypothetical protein
MATLAQETYLTHLLRLQTQDQVVAVLLVLEQGMQAQAVLAVQAS